MKMTLNGERAPILMLFSFLLFACSGNKLPESDTSESDAELARPDTYASWSSPTRIAFDFLIALHKTGSEEMAAELLSESAKQLQIVRGRATKIDDFSIIVLEEHVDLAQHKADITVEITGTMQGVNRKASRVVSLVTNNDQWFIENY